jgi:hypothetical protein
VLRQYLVCQANGAVGCMNCRQPTRTRVWMYAGDKSGWWHFCFKCSQTAAALAEMAGYVRVDRPPPARYSSKFAMLGALAAMAGASMPPYHSPRRRY